MNPYDHYNETLELVGLLRNENLGAQANALLRAMEEGATGSEIFMALRWNVNNIINAKTSIDNTPPVVTNLKVDSALVQGRTDRVQTIVSWQTDEPSTSTIFYQEGTSGSKDSDLSNKEEDEEFTRNHVMILGSLKPGAVYRFTISSTDDVGNSVRLPVRTIITPKKTESIVDVIFKNFDETFDFINNVR